MRRSAFLYSLVLLLMLGASRTAHAQVVPPEANPVQAVITAPGDIAVGHTIVLDASASRTTGERTEYRWSIDETKQVIGRDVEAIFTPEKPGKLTFRLMLRSTTLDGRMVQAETTQVVVVYRRKVILIADRTVQPDVIAANETEALRNGTYLRVLRLDASTPSLAVEDALTKLLSEQKDAVVGADTIVVWTEGIAGLQALMRSVQVDKDLQPSMQHQTIVLITDQNLGNVGRTTRGALTLLKPLQMIVTEKEALNPLITAPDIDAFKVALATHGIDSLPLTAASFTVRPWNALSILVSYLLSHGVSSQTVIILLMLPVIATMFAILKQVIGITTFGLYTPSIVALSFLALGWWIGLLFLLFILATGYLTRTVMKRWSLLYIPKVAIILTVVSATLLCLVAIGTAAGLTFSRETVFILLILSTLAENFLQLKTEEGWWSAFMGIGETVLGALLCVFVVQWAFLQSLILAYPELLIVTIAINVFLGRWTGLRLVEYFRFREVFQHLAEE